METLIACPSCHLHTRAHERDCPHCGAPLRTPTGRVAPTSVALLMGLSLMACGSSALYGAPVTESDSEVTTTEDTDGTTTEATEGSSSSTTSGTTGTTGTPTSSSTTGDTETTGGTETTGDTDPTAGTAGSTTALYGSPALP